MTDSAPAGADPRIPLSRRLDQFLRGIERANRQPNRREAYHLQDALEHLAEGRLEKCEEAVVQAERMAPLPAHVAHLLATDNPVTVTQLLAELNSIMKQAPR